MSCKNLYLYSLASFVAFGFVQAKSSSTTNTLAQQCINDEGSTINIKLLPDNDDDDNEVDALTEFPFVQAQCGGNGYLIVDIDKDTNWLNYFTSQKMYHHSLMGPLKDDILNWDEWFMPEIDSYLVSPDCSTCDEDELLNSLYSTSSVYYMMAANAGCTQLPIGRIGCDMDYNTYECRACKTLNTRNDGYWGNIAVYNGLNKDKYESGEAIFLNEKTDYEDYRFGLCGFTIRDAFASHSSENDTFSHCKKVTHEDTNVYTKEFIVPRRKPSIGTSGEFCICVKPPLDDFDNKFEYLTDEEYDLKYNSQSTEEDSEVNTLSSSQSKTTAETLSQIAKQKERDSQNSENEENEEISEEYGYYELYQSDFEEGTYRITTPGTYVIMEDIVFDFNAPDGWKDGGLDGYNGKDHWFPKEEHNVEEKYPGAYDLYNPYFMGFYAGIAIECSSSKGVILDLNGHTLSQSKGFYYQQTFFAIIALSGQAFLPGQGPGFFGASPSMAENVVIKNGKLGLTSHHGIQGNLNKNVLIENLDISDFQTHGIQLNGFKDIEIKNVEIHHNHFQHKLSPFYAHLRHYLPIYRQMTENDDDVVSTMCINFGNRQDNTRLNSLYSLTDDEDCVTLDDYIVQIEILLDIAFEFAVFDKTDEELVETMDEKTAKLWHLNKNMLINGNRDKRPWTATLYGIFLNYVGSNVIGWYAGSQNTKSEGLLINNVYIHDLTHDTTENVAFSQGGATAKQRILNCLNAPFNAFHVFGEQQVDLISNCNVYGNPDKNPECSDLEHKLKYVGNILTDSQLATFYLINKHGLSWNYCASGAADMNALTQFAMGEGTFVEGTPLLATTHDPMIHPGKGVLGLRLNGVSDAQIHNVKIENIESRTALGSLLNGNYDFTVSQQKPYMSGFSMNMANGMSVTMCDQMLLDGVEITGVRSFTGLAYGLAIWYETKLLVKNEVKVTNIIAGKELTKDTNYVDDILESSDYLPNKKPEVCAIRLYDDDSKKITVHTEVNGRSVNELVTVECIRGYVGCVDSENIVTMLGETNLDAECDLDSDEDYDDEKENGMIGMGNVNVNKNANVKVNPNSNGESKVSMGNVGNSAKQYKYSVILVVVAIVVSLLFAMIAIIRYSRKTDKLLGENNTHDFYSRNEFVRGPYRTVHFVELE